ncbi:hypothetical protein [Mesorhizobium salmacidum]|uniref:Peptidase M41 domain-containing protein n=1 Tax=Mesorhizobium salmacidum TaxID=3015171 RepID=A0ABU8L745_9HYPH
MDNDLRHTAIHEAGHAVIGRVLGMGCGYATIIADDDSAGHGIVGDPWQILGDWEQRERYRDASTVFHGRMMSFMAGALAEYEFFGTCEGGDGDDQWQIVMMAEDGAAVPKRSGIWEADRDRHIDRLRTRTAGLVRRHRGRIAKVADALAECGTLSSEEIDALIR